MKTQQKRTVQLLMILSCFALFQSSAGAKTIDSGDSVKQQTLREEVNQLLSREPGTYFRNAIRETNRTVGVIQYHITRLERSGQIFSFQVSNYKGYFPSSMKDISQKHKTALVMLRTPVRGKIIRYLMNNQIATQSDISKVLGISVQNLSYHLKCLQNYGIITKVRQGNTNIINLDESLAEFLTQWI